MTQQESIDEYASLPDEAQRQAADFLASLRRQHDAAPSVHQHGADGLENEAFIGRWRDRQDAQDSAAWVRNVRKTQWGESA